MFIQRRGSNPKKLVGIVMLLATSALPQQSMSNFDRERAQTILQVVANDVRKNYYDPKFHGVDWDAKVVEAKQKIEKDTSFNMSMSHIAAALDSLDDSHTFLLPPQHAFRHDYGWQYQIVGESPESRSKKEMASSLRCRPLLS